MDLGVIITALIGIVTTFSSSLITWIFSRRKYNAEVDNKTLQNLSGSVEVYNRITQDLEKKIDSYIELSEQNRLEVIRLKGIVYRLINKICTDGTCTNRQPYTTEEVEEIMGILKESSKKESKETDLRI